MTGSRDGGWLQAQAQVWGSIEVHLVALPTRPRRPGGGAELGRAWWTQGRGAAWKQGTFVDYVAVRDALVAAGWAVFSRAPRLWRAARLRYEAEILARVLCQLRLR